MPAADKTMADVEHTSAEQAPGQAMSFVVNHSEGKRNSVFTTLYSTPEIMSFTNEGCQEIFATDHAGGAMSLS